MTIEDQVALFYQAGLVKHCPPARAKGLTTRDGAGGRLSYDITPLESDDIKEVRRLFKATQRARGKANRKTWKAAK